MEEQLSESGCVWQKGSPAGGGQAPRDSGPSTPRCRRARAMHLCTRQTGRLNVTSGAGDLEGVTRN